MARGAFLAARRADPGHHSALALPALTDAAYNPQALARERAQTTQYLSFRRGSKKRK